MARRYPHLGPWAGLYIRESASFHAGLSYLQDIFARGRNHFPLRSSVKQRSGNASF